MSDRLAAHQRIRLFEFGNYCLVNFVYMLTCKLARARGIDPVFVNEIQRTDAVCPAHIKVIDTVVGCSVDCAGTGIGGDMIAQDDGHFALGERMVKRLLV